MSIKGGLGSSGGERLIPKTHPFWPLRLGDKVMCRYLGVGGVVVKVMGGGYRVVLNDGRSMTFLRAALTKVKEEGPVNDLLKLDSI